MGNSIETAVIVRHEKEHLVDLCLLEEPNVWVVYATYNLKTDNILFKDIFNSQDGHGRSGVSKAFMKNFELFEYKLRELKENFNKVV